MNSIINVLGENFVFFSSIWIFVIAAWLFMTKTNRPGVKKSIAMALFGVSSFLLFYTVGYTTLSEHLFRRDIKNLYANMRYRQKNQDASIIYVFLSKYTEAMCHYSNLHGKFDDNLGKVYGWVVRNNKIYNFILTEEYIGNRPENFVVEMTALPKLYAKKGQYPVKYVEIADNLDSNNYSYAVELINEQPLEILDIVDVNGITLLMRAVASQNIAAIKALLAKGVNTEQVNIFFDRAVDLAQQIGHKPMIKIFNEYDLQTQLRRNK